MKPTLAIAALLLISGAPARAELDLARADVSRLPNGLIVIILEDRTLPVVSTQLLVKSGARDETAGKTGLAHFLEHLAFRASAAFPGASATEAIYDAGGEWHGYTWLDQTTYYATVPRDGLDLLLRIEADRLANVTIDPAALAAEKGAVITEMHGYENDPSSVLLDAVTATALQAHPYRNNTIGYESDVAALTLDDASDFYRRHYTPANSVLSIVGDISTAQAKALVARHFGAIAARPAPLRTAAVEPPQRGERRTMLAGPTDRPMFTLAFPAPAASNRDFAAFLVLQQLLGGGSGINFDHNDWGTPAKPGSLLEGAADGIATWFIPTADRYIFTIKGALPDGASEVAVEQALAERLARAGDTTPAKLAAAKAAVRQQLAEDVETTEDAAHQLAYFEGIGALDTLIGLPRAVAAVSAADIARVARAYLAPSQRTVGWLVPGEAPATGKLGAGSPSAAQPRAGKPAQAFALSPPVLRTLSAGLPAIVQASPLSPNVTVELLLSAPVTGEQPPRDLPGLGRVVRSGPASALPALIAEASEAARAAPLPQVIASDDPDTRIQQMIASETAPLTVNPPQPIAVVVSGAVQPANAFATLEQAIGRTAAATLPAPPAARQPHQKVVAEIAKPLSQGALGYVVATPPPGTRDGLAWRMLLYILTHDYSGRLGRSAIGDKGLAYHIYSSFRTDGRRAWATVWTGVDPAHADALEAELKAQLAGLQFNPPTTAEVEAARRHLLGRDLSAAQNNAEIADKLARQFVETGGVRSHAELAALLATITPADLAAIAPAFARGTILRVDVGVKR
ncbi:insulinase family protein [Sphingomonas sp.]|uniref:insulinase family protein n=1 Tax=Sphingomonas sp. TaxID=28214 RepID=UPI00286E1FC3|nr:insulinase family protein [Sphingomonas sp.]